jgi:NADH-ubiquinone oxidoreductase chain 5
MGSDFWANSLFVHPNHLSMIEAEFAIPIGYKLLPLIGSLFGAGLALILYHSFPLFTINLTNTNIGRSLYRFLNQKYWFDNVYNNLILSPLLNFGYITNKVLDRGAIELIGPYGLVSSFRIASNRITSFDTGFIPHYALYIFLGVVSFITLIFYVEDPKYFILLLSALIFSKPSKNNTPSFFK